jgi:lipoxygenase homology domain-containing protein 1
VQINVFSFEAVSLQSLTKLVIGHNGRGHGAGWFLDRVIVRELDEEDSGNFYLFPCNRWFDEYEEDGKVERELTVAGL